MANPSRYRFIKFYGGRILQSREVSEIQRIQEGLDSTGTTKVAFDLNAIYRSGATFNIGSTINVNSVTLSPINSALPMQVFVRGRWEVLQPAEISNPLTLTNGSGNIYINWVIRQVTSAEDTTLIDTNTSQPTADMGELDLSVSTTDNSGIALSSTQFEKNTTSIILFTYNNQLLAPIDNVNIVSLANANTSGLVSLTTNTSHGKAAASDDPRLIDGRSPLVNSVANSSVRTPLAVNPAAKNSDGTPVYNLTSDIGGIDSKKIVHSTGTQLVSDAIEWIKGQLSGIASTLNNHIGVRLGVPGTHPMPSAIDVGATPISHVGMSLGLPGSHPPAVTANSTGFVVYRQGGVIPGNADAAYAVNESGNLKSAMLHTGDFFNSICGNVIANPVGTPTTGNLSLYSTTTRVLAEHVNQTSHANPHGLTAGDLGAATTGYVDASSANALAAAKLYTDQDYNNIQAEFVNNITGNGYQRLPNGLIIQWMTGANVMTGRGTIQERWPISFHTCFMVQVSVAATNYINGNWQGMSFYVQPGANNVTVGLYADVASGSTRDTPFRAFLLGIGY